MPLIHDINLYIPRIGRYREDKWLNLFEGKQNKLSIQEATWKIIELYLGGGTDLPRNLVSAREDLFLLLCIRYTVVPPQLEPNPAVQP